MQKINREQTDLNDSLDHMDTEDMFRTILLKAEEYTVFSSAHGTFSRIYHTVGFQSVVNKYKETKITPRTL